MFVFVISLRHYANANNFEKVEQLLTYTLQSLCGQSYRDFKIVVVCNKQPNVTYQDERIVYHIVDFAPPSDKKASALESKPKFKDKGTKYLSGLLLAKKWNPKYVFIFDADDWLNKDVLKAIDAGSDYPIWYVNQGYMVSYPNKDFRKISGFNRYCGSSYVYDYQFLMSQANFSADVDESSSQDALIAATSEFFVCRLLANHTITFRYFSDKGYEPRAIPLRASCWLQGTGENVSGTKGRANGAPINREFIETFNIPDDFISSNTLPLKKKVKNFLSTKRSELTWLFSRLLKKTIY